MPCGWDPKLQIQAGPPTAQARVLHYCLLPSSAPTTLSTGCSAWLGMCLEGTGEQGKVMTPECWYFPLQFQSQDFVWGSCCPRKPPGAWQSAASSWAFSVTTTWELELMVIPYSQSLRGCKGRMAQAVSWHMQSKNNSKHSRPSRTQSQEVSLTHFAFVFWPLKKTFHIVYYGITENGNFSEIPPHTSWKAHPQKDCKE